MLALFTFNPEHPLALVFGVGLDVGDERALGLVEDCPVVLGPSSNLVEKVGQRRFRTAHRL
jgi:hypothetical protein